MCVCVCVCVCVLLDFYFYFENGKDCDFEKKIHHFFEIKIIKLTTSKPKHFVGHHLY
jgi:hypothetical protein